MSQFLALTVAGVATYGCVYALTAMGLVVTYTTSGIFNFAQGAIGMIGAFLYWELRVHLGWPAWASLILVVLILVPLLGAVIERLVIRRLQGAALEAQLTVTIALLLLGIAVATAVWDPQTDRTLPQFFNGSELTIGTVTVTVHQVMAVGAALAAALGLRLFLYRTRAGIATRAVVDDRDLVALTGATPARYGQLGWAMGCGLAALAGVLIAPLVTLDITTLTLLVINGYAAAMVGRLRSLPLTFAGAVALGLVYSYAIGYLPVSATWQYFQQIIPMVFLLLVMLLRPQARVGTGPRVRARAPRTVGLRESLVSASVFMVAAVLAARLLPSGALGYADQGVALAVILLSLVLLTGYGAQVSLCQLTFAGIGAWAMSVVGGPGGSLLGLLAAAGLAAAVGALVAIPALRLRGLYLALTTLAFAVGMDDAFFSNTRVFGIQLTKVVARPHIPGVSMRSDRSYLVLLAVVYALSAVAILAFRRCRAGRRLIAVNDSPAACLTLGIDMTRPKLAVFAVSAGLAGLGGALYGGSLTAVASTDFGFLLSLTMLLIAVAWGVRTASGMLLGGIVLSLSPLLERHVSTPRDFFSLLVGMAAIGVSQNPEGTFGGNTLLQRWRDRQGEVARVGTGAELPDGSHPGTEGVLSRAAG